MNRTELIIEGMTCDACARRVEAALNALPGIAATVYYAAGTAHIRAEADLDRARIDRAVADAGYRVAGDMDDPARTRAPDGAGRHIAIIGSGGGAFAAAIRAVEAGASVTMIERGTLGGTCVNVGCVPSKITLRAAEIAHRQRAHPFAGIPVADGTIDRAALLDQVRERVDQLRGSKYERILEQHEGIDRMHGHARFTDPATVEVEQAAGDMGRLSPDRILIAVGASPAVPAIPGLEEAPWWTSTNALFADETPEHLAVIGGSFVACEIAQAFRRLGSAVTILARSRLLSHEAPEVGEALEAAFEAEGIGVLRDTQARQVSHDGHRFRLDLPDERIEADRLLVAMGRTPNTTDLNLKEAGVETDEHGAIRVDAGLRTSADGIYAVVDCATMPQIAAVGRDEHEARAAGVETLSRRLDLDQVPRALANFDSRGFVRLIAEADSGRLLGARIVAHNAGEIIQTAALAIRAGMTVEEMAGELFPYLTLAESLKLCAQTFTHDVSQLSCCAG